MDLRKYFKPCEGRRVCSSEAPIEAGSDSGTSDSGSLASPPCSQAGADRASTSNSQVSGHVVGYNIKWEEEYKWLVPYRDEVGVITGMFCELCIRYKCKNKYNHSAVWNETPCVCLRKDSVRRHSVSKPDVP